MGGVNWAAFNDPGVIGALSLIILIFEVFYLGILVAPPYEYGGVDCMDPRVICEPPPTSHFLYHGLRAILFGVNEN